MFLQVVTTLASADDAERLAHELVERRLAACVQVIGPLSSTYRWQGSIETAQEWQCVVKTHGRLYERVEAAIRALHSYETPEILATRIECGSDAYLAWLVDQLEVDRP